MNTEGGSVFLQNVGTKPRDNTVHQSKRLLSKEYSVFPSSLSWVSFTAVKFKFGVMRNT